MLKYIEIHKFFCVSYTYYSMAIDTIKHYASHYLSRLVVWQELCIALVISIGMLSYWQFASQNSIRMLQNQNTIMSQKIRTISKNYVDLKNQDQYKINQELKSQIKNIQDAYSKSISMYEHILELQSENQDTSLLTQNYAQTVTYLSQLNYASASSTLIKLNDLISSAQDKYNQSQAATQTSSNATTSNTPPGIGFSVQNVQTPNGTFTVYIIAADLNSTRVIVDTASSGDCANNCPVLPLDNYISRSGAYAGINGTFFCPADYPSCAGKTGSFDTLLMNKNKTYFNSANNVYSTVPLVYFTGNTMGVRGASSDWGRDTSIDSVIAMQPLLLSNNQIVYNGSNDPKFGNKGSRGFIGNIGNTVYIGDVLGATMSDSANVLHTLGLNNALNLDEGGSTALWDGGYKLGPGRNIPNAILFVRK